MSQFWNRRLPLAVAFVSGLLMVVAFFSGDEAVSSLSDHSLRWVTIVGGFALLLGVVSITQINVGKVTRRDRNWPYSIILLLALAASGGFGILQGTGDGTVYDWLFQRMLSPMMSTMFAMLAFFIASAAYRAFRARSVEATILLVVATIVMLGRIPVGQALYGQLPHITDWIMNYPNLAVQRGIIIGAALGAASMSLRVILGIERSYLGRK